MDTGGFDGEDVRLPPAGEDRRQQSLHLYPQIRRAFMRGVRRNWICGKYHTVLWGDAR